MLRKLPLIIGLALILILPSCEIVDSEEENYLLSKGWEFYDVKASANGEDITSSVIRQYDNDFGLIYSFYDDGTYSIDLDEIQYESGVYDFNENTLILSLDGDLYDVTITDDLMVLSYSYYDRGEVVSIRKFFN